ncbi:MAG: DUF3352 domain-containing protein [Bacteroidia bacterium]
MFKKIFFGTFVTAVIVAGIFGFFYLRKIKTPVSTAINAIPADAVFIIRSNSADIFWKKISQNNIIWQDFLSENIFSDINKNGFIIDSLIQNSPDIIGLLDENPFFISAHETQKNHLDFLFSYSLPDITKREIVEDFINKSFKDKKKYTQNFDGISVNSISVEKNTKFNYAFSKGIFIAGFNLTLVQKAIQQTENGTSLLQDKNFSQVFNTAGKAVDATLFVNYERIHSSLNTYLENENRDFFSPFANWTALDFSVKPSEVMLDGFSVADISQKKFLNLFSKQKPQNIELTSVVPANTAMFLLMGISDVTSFKNDYSEFLNRKKNSDTLVNVVKKNIFSWTENEIALVVTEPESSDWSDNAYAIFHSNEIENAKATLNNLTDSLNALLELKTDSENYQGVGIYHLPVKNELSEIFGTIFSSITNNYYTIVGDYVVFANSSEALKKFIQANKSGKTLQNDIYYKEFSSDHLDKESNVYFYANIARSTKVLESVLKNNFSKELENKLPLLQKFQAFGIQFSADKGVFYTNAYFKRNPIYKKESNSIWEIKLDTTVSTQPYFVTNHLTGEKEIFVQDDANKIYLISNTGKILWKQSLDKKIKGGVTQIDRYKNDKLQLLFNTTSSIYLIDRNGKNVEGYPVKLPANATNSLAVFDYENNKDYRMMIACADKHIYNYEADGSLVDGWKFDVSKNVILAPIERCTVAGKDYIVAIDSTGDTYFLDRQGRTRLQLQNTLHAPVTHFFIDAEKNLEQSKIICADTLGNILRLSFRDEPETIKIGDFKENPYFDYKDLDNTKIRKYIFLTHEKLSVYNPDKSYSFSYDFKTEMNKKPLFFLYPDNSGRIGVVSKSTNELFLIDNNGRLCSGFLLYGNTLFSIADMNNDGQLYLITGSPDKNIILYQLQ